MIDEIREKGVFERCEPLTPIRNHLGEYDHQDQRESSSKKWYFSSAQILTVITHIRFDVPMYKSLFVTLFYREYHLWKGHFQQITLINVPNVPQLRRIGRNFLRKYRVR